MISESEYGAGTVLIWDRGTHENITGSEDGLRPVSEALAKGHVLVRLSGEKIHGSYALLRIDDNEDQWLLIRSDLPGPAMASVPQGGLSPPHKRR